MNQIPPNPPFAKGVANPRHCRACHHFEPSKLARYGYCGSAIDHIQRARLLPDGTVCLFLTEWSTS